MITTTSKLGALRHRLHLLADSFNPGDRRLLSEVLAMAEAAHKGQLRKPGREADVQPYLIHPIRVALVIMEELNFKDPSTIAAALLHDVIEDSSKYSIRDIELNFGRKVALMVSILSKPPTDDSISREEQLAIYYKRISAAAIPTRLVKLADRLDNLRDAVNCGDPEFQSRYLSETRKIFLPIAQSTNQYLFNELTRCSLKLEAALTDGIFEPCKK